MHGKKPSCGHAVHFYLQGPEPQLTACRDFIEVSDSRQLHPLSRYHGETLNTGYYRFTLQPLQERHRRFSRLFLELNFIFARLEWLHS